MDFKSIPKKNQVAVFQKLDYKDMIRSRMSTKFFYNFVEEHRLEIAKNPTDLCLYIKLCTLKESSDSETTPNVTFFVNKRLHDPYNQLAGLLLDKIIVFRAEGSESLLQSEAVPLLKKMGTKARTLFTSFLTNSSIELLVEAVEPKEISIYHTYKEFSMKTFFENPMMLMKDYLKIGCGGSKTMMYLRGITKAFRYFREIHLTNLDPDFIHLIMAEMRNMSDIGILRFIELPVKYDFFSGKYCIPSCTVYWQHYEEYNDTKETKKSLKYTSMHVMAGPSKWLVCLERESPFPSKACYRLIVVDPHIGMLDKLRTLINKGFEVESMCSDDSDSGINSPMKRLCIEKE